MYNLSGLYYQMKVDSFVYGAVSLLLLLNSRFWVLEKRNIKTLIIGLVCCVLCVCSLVYHYSIISNLRISVHEGTFVEEHRENPYLFRREYCFSNEGGLKPLFHLDIFSKKEIYPNDFEKNARYRIHYEEKTDIIVKVEKLE